MNRSTSFALLAALTVTGLAGAQSQPAGKTATPTAQSARGGTAMTMTGSSCARVLKARVNLNKASEADLRCLRGVSATTAKDIIANRPFKDSGDFSRKIEVIGRKLWNDNKANLTF